MSLFTVLRPHNRLLIFKFKTSQAMATAFMRMQEFAENPVFYGRTFSRKECDDWYISNMGAKYNSIVDGCNIDGLTASIFIANAKAKKFGKLIYQEKTLIEALDQYAILPRSYIIAYGEDSSPVLQHEMAHALYNIDFCYRNQVVKILGKLNLYTTNKYRYILTQHGYRDGVFLDEIHAYLLDDFWYTRTLLKVDKENLFRQITFWIAHRKLLKLFKNYLKYNALENILK